MRGHPGRTLVRRPVVEEVVQQLGVPAGPVQTLVDEGGEDRVLQQNLVGKRGGKFERFLPEGARDEARAGLRRFTR